MRQLRVGGCWANSIALHTDSLGRYARGPTATSSVVLGDIAKVANEDIHPVLHERNGDTVVVVTPVDEGLELPQGVGRAVWLDARELVLTLVEACVAPVVLGNPLTLVTHMPVVAHRLGVLLELCRIAAHATTQIGHVLQLTLVVVAGQVRLGMSEGAQVELLLLWREALEVRDEHRSRPCVDALQKLRVGIDGRKDSATKHMTAHRGRSATEQAPNITVMHRLLGPLVVGHVGFPAELTRPKVVSGDVEQPVPTCLLNTACREDRRIEVAFHQPVRVHHHLGGQEDAASIELELRPFAADIVLRRHILA